MKKLRYGFIAILLVGCNNKNPQDKNTENKDSTEAVKAYFPVIDYIKSELHYIDSLPVGIIKYTTENGLIDSSYIKPEEVHALANTFLSEELGKEKFEKQFKENSFFDQTTQNSTFTYSAISETTPVQRVDIITKPDNVFDKVKSIYIVKTIRKGDSSITQKLYWKAEKSFQITTEVRKGEQLLPAKQVKVVWNPWE